MIMPIPLIASILNSQGYKTFVMEESDETIRQSPEME